MGRWHDRWVGAAAVFCLTGVLALAAGTNNPVAFVAGSGPIVINGTNFETAGVPSWPVVIGDEVGTGNVFAMILFRDGRRILLEANTRVRIQQTDGRPDISVLNGKIVQGPLQDLKVDGAALARRLPYRMGFTGNH